MKAGLDEPSVREAIRLIKTSKKFVAFTGAGVSAESGVPTFRGKDGYWKRYRTEELATPEAFNRDPQLVWEWYDQRRQILSKVKPNPAHYTIARLEEGMGDFTLITQNVDGLHSLAGSRRVLEIHGNIWRVRCTVCGAVEKNRQVPIPIPPYCNRCGGLQRPDVVWFGEMLPETVLSESYRSLESCDTILVVGTSGVVQPAASFVHIAKENGAKVIEVNIDETPLSFIADLSLRGRAGDILPMLAGDAQG